MANLGPPGDLAKSGSTTTIHLQTTQGQYIQVPFDIKHIYFLQENPVLVSLVVQPMGA
jgi:cupin superfamily acireductone dioxygenase involved in methionine salvage